MQLQKTFPLILSAFIMAVGLLFLSSAMFELSFLTPMQRRVPLAVIAVVFIAAGALFIILHQRGNLRRQGKTLKQVRKEAVAKLDSEELLANIALEDPQPEIRETAKQRLRELQ